MGMCEEYTRTTALHWLDGLLNSPDSYRTARCSNTECRFPYYVRKRVRKAEIKRGM
jgi:hypothetical protein